MCSQPGLTPGQVAFFRDNGYLVIPNYLSQDTLSNLLSTTTDLLDSFSLSSHPLTRFTTGDDETDTNNAKHELEGEAGDDYVPVDEDFEMLDIPAGSLVLIHGNALHKSEKNTSEKSRFAYTFHVIEGDEGWNYDDRNWLQPPEDGKGFTRLFAGKG
ncbi:hypothetical protein CIHG_04919 [Coccidioides immitis H538.4]|uniref:Phytanoyl-CoA dioxygenase family protein n=1 Tax=Coccidioides immitis H538.4 TaxID=396776 RepID=A0A0J8RSQ1_COCIT|nr:hypothetical protein CIHG_04919 [Coccidioides immitis H538.4]